VLVYLSVCASVPSYISVLVYACISVFEYPRIRLFVFEGISVLVY